MCANTEVSCSDWRVVQIRVVGKVQVYMFHASIDVGRCVEMMWQCGVMVLLKLLSN